MALVAASLVCSAAATECSNLRKVDHLSQPSAILSLAIWIRSFRLNRHGGGGDINDFSQRDPLEDIPREGDSRITVCGSSARGGMDSDSVGHFEDPGDTKLVFVQRGFERTAIHRAVLDLRREKTNRLGRLLEACGREYVVDISVTGFLLLGFRRPFSQSL